MTKDKKILVLNIATDSKDTSLGFAISWLNEFSKNYQEVDVITLKKGDAVTIEYKGAMSSGKSTFKVTAKNSLQKIDQIGRLAIYR